MKIGLFAWARAVLAMEWAGFESDARALSFRTGNWIRCGGICQMRA